MNHQEIDWKHKYEKCRTELEEILVQNMVLEEEKEALEERVGELESIIDEAAEETEILSDKLRRY